MGSSVQFQVFIPRGMQNIFPQHRCLNLPEVPRHPPTHSPHSALNCWLWSVVSAELIRTFDVLQGLNYVLPTLDSNRWWEYGLSRNSLQKRPTVTLRNSLAGAVPRLTHAGRGNPLRACPLRIRVRVCVCGEVTQKKPKMRQCQVGISG